MGSALQVLLIGKSSDLAEALGRAMGGSVGCTAVSVEEAKRRAERGEVGCVVTLPGGGRENIEALAEIPHPARPRIVCLAAERDRRQALLRFGADIVLGADASVREIAAAIGVLSGDRRTHSEDQNIALRRHLSLERLLVSVSRGFLSTDIESMDDAIYAALRDVAEFLDVDRLQLVQYQEDMSLVISHEYTADSAPASVLRSRYLRAEAVPLLHRAMEDDRELAFSDPMDASDAMRHELRGWVDGATQSMRIQAIRWGGKPVGFLAASTLGRARHWGDDDATLMGMLADILANALWHQREDRALRDSEATMRAMLDAMGRALGLMVVDRNLRIVQANRGIDETFGKAEDRFCYELCAQGDMPCEACPVVQVWEDGETHISQRRYVDRQGQAIYYDVLACPVFDDYGRLSRVLLACKDISEQKRTETEKNGLERQLRHSQKMEAIGTLAGGIAHDFNNILAAIMGYTDLAAEKIPESDKTLRFCVEQILQAAGRARDLVQQILTFGRQAEQERKPIELQPIVKEALKLLRASLPTTIDIRQRILAEGAIVMADPTQMHQVLMNLCTNAYHAMKQSGGTLEVTLSIVRLDAAEAARHANLGEGDYVCLAVSDTGSGMEPQVIERIFEPFFTTKAMDEGSGMGLSVVDGIVGSHAGCILVESEVGQGSTFRVLLPLHGQAAAESVEPRAPLPRGNKERVLFIDDEAAIADVGARMLRHMGYQVDVLSNSLAALEAFEKAPDVYDVVITDQTMPGITGSQLAVEMLARRPNLPIMLITGHSDLVSAEEAYALGVREFAEKPFSMRTLGAALGRCLAHTDVDARSRTTPQPGV